MSAVGKGGKGGKRSAARLAAIQALYQMEMQDGDDVEALILEFLTHRPGAMVDEEGDGYAEIDRELFADLVRGVARRLGQIDGLISPALAAGWPLHRLERILRAVLRGGVYEFLMRPDIPPKVIISEYVELAADFFSGDEPGMVNAVLDRIGRGLRSGELAVKNDERPREAG